MNFFKPSDFLGTVNNEYVSNTDAARVANLKLEREGHEVFGESNMAPWHNVSFQGMKCKALLINIEPIGCQHKRTRMWEPHLAGARKCEDCGLVKNPNKGEHWFCEHPTDKIKLINNHVEGKMAFNGYVPGSVEAGIPIEKLPHTDYFCCFSYQCECGAMLEPASFKEKK